MATRATQTATLPRVQVWHNHAFYLRPDGATGPEAIVYLPAFNDRVRQGYVRKGLKLLSRCSGDLSEKGENELRIEPPDDDTIRMAIEAIASRQAAVRAELEEEIADVELGLKEGAWEGKERGIYAQKLRQLKAKIKVLEDGVPEFNRLKLYFINEHRMRIVQKVPAATRAALANMALESQWSQLGEEIGREAVKRQRGRKPDGEPVPA